MYPHRIRLRGPWEIASADQAPFTVSMPCRWIETPLAAAKGPIRLSRRFGWPGRIDAHERVWLTIAGGIPKAEIQLNGVALDPPSTVPGEWEVTSRIVPRNELALTFTSIDAAGDGLGEVALEVRCQAYLRHITAKLDLRDNGVRLCVRGELIGMSERPLDFYVLVDGRNVAYTTLKSELGDSTFEVVSDGLDAEMLNQRTTHLVRVELVDGGTVWYEWEQAI